jgi:hypothetical protein
VSATVLGLTLLGSTLLGSTSQGQTSPHSPLHESRGPTSSQGGNTNTPSPPQGLGMPNTHTMAGTNPPPPPQMPYLASLNIPDLNKLINDPILYNPTWPIMPTKIPSDILLSLKFRPHRATRTPHRQHRKTVIHGTRLIPQHKKRVKTIQNGQKITRRFTPTGRARARAISSYLERICAAVG